MTDKRIPLTMNFIPDTDHLLAYLDIDKPAVEVLMDLLQEGRTVEICPTLEDGKVTSISVVTHTAKKFGERRNET